MQLSSDVWLDGVDECDCPHCPQMSGSMVLMNANVHIVHVCLFCFGGGFFGGDFFLGGDSCCCDGGNINVVS